MPPRGTLEDANISVKMNVQDRIRVDLLGRGFGKSVASDGWAYLLPFVFVTFKFVKF